MQADTTLPETGHDDHGRIPRPPFHPHVQAVMDAVHLPPFTPDLLPQLRKQNTGSPDDLTHQGLVREDLQVPGHEGVPITLSTWRHQDADDPRSTHVPAGPCFVFLHGGGMVSGDRFDDGDIIPELLADGGVLVGVEYRLAPEHPAPTPVEDCYAALLWITDHATQLGINPSQIILGGTSAGGGLAAGVMLLARDRKGPTPRGVWLNAPMLDDRNDTVSARQFRALGLFWTGISNQTGWADLLAGQQPTIYDAPARAGWLGGLPPVLITVGSAEPFRDEAVAFASALWRDGDDCQLLVVPGGIHCYADAAPDASITTLHQHVVKDWVTHQLRPDTPDGAAPAIKQLKPLENLYRT